MTEPKDSPSISTSGDTVLFRYFMRDIRTLIGGIVFVAFGALYFVIRYGFNVPGTLEGELISIAFIIGGVVIVLIYIFSPTLFEVHDTFLVYRFLYRARKIPYSSISAMKDYVPEDDSARKRLKGRTLLELTIDGGRKKRAIIPSKVMRGDQVLFDVKSFLQSKQNKNI